MVVAPYGVTRHPHADLFEHLVLPRICRQFKIDLYHGTFQVMPWLRAAPVTVATIHDLALFDFPQAYSRKFGPYMRTLMRRAIRHSDHLITVSDATALAITSRFPTAKKKVTTVHNGVGGEFVAWSTDQAKPSPQYQNLLPRPYILYVGNLERKKNLPRLIRAFLQLRASGGIRESLLIVGAKPDKLPADDIAELFGTSASDVAWQEKATAVGVHFLGYVPDQDLPAIYRQASAVAYPSLYEGFGMPVLEAMASGVPVLTSNLSSLPEVAGGAAWLCDPTCVESIASGLRKVLDDSSWRATAIASGLQRSADLSWQHNAEKTEQLYLRWA
jgi:glycosyltransferase involved in cell wall biosynthesis